jgi:hypothetical protein
MLGWKISTTLLFKVLELKVNCNLIHLNSIKLAVSRIALVKPDKARGVEDVVLRAAQTGGISEKVINM